MFVRKPPAAWVMFVRNDSATRSAGPAPWQYNYDASTFKCPAQQRAAADAPPHRSVPKLVAGGRPDRVSMRRPTAAVASGLAGGVQLSAIR